MKQKFQAYLIKTNPVDQWHRKLGHIHPSRLHQISLRNQEIPQFSMTELSSLQCVPCITAKARRSQIAPSARYNTRPLELIHLDISGPVERSLQNYQYTAAILDDFTAKSDVYFLKEKI